MQADLPHTTLGVAGALAIACITPGPNNFIVMRAGTRAGLAAALPAILGIVAGSLVMLGLALSGKHLLLTAWPQSMGLLALVGAGYLVWLGLRLCLTRRRHVRAGAPPDQGSAPPGPLRLFAFQFINPKGWALIFAVSAAAGTQASPRAAFMAIAALIVPISALSLLVWAAAGAWMSRWLAAGNRALRFDQAMGLLLIACALPMLVSV